jgi:hypothetical protein
MSKRHTASRSFVQKPNMAWLLVKESKWDIGEWVRMTLDDAYVLAAVLRAEGIETAILGTAR